jgi:hypothetical protein
MASSPFRVGDFAHQTRTGERFIVRKVTASRDLKTGIIVPNLVVQRMYARGPEQLTLFAPETDAIEIVTS